MLFPSQKLMSSFLILPYMSSPSLYQNVLLGWIQLIIQSGSSALFLHPLLCLLALAQVVSYLLSLPELKKHKNVRKNPWGKWFCFVNYFWKLFLNLFIICFIVCYTDQWQCSAECQWRHKHPMNYTASPTQLPWSRRLGILLKKATV